MDEDGKMVQLQTLLFINILPDEIEIGLAHFEGGLQLDVRPPMIS